METPTKKKLTREQALTKINSLYPSLNDREKGSIRWMYFDKEEIPEEDMLNRISTLPVGNLRTLLFQMKNSITKKMKAI